MKKLSCNADLMACGIATAPIPMKHMPRTYNISGQVKGKPLQKTLRWIIGGNGGQTATKCPFYPAQSYLDLNGPNWHNQFPFLIQP
jgi:hypothetical protein